VPRTNFSLLLALTYSSGILSPLNSFKIQTSTIYMWMRAWPAHYIPALSPRAILYWKSGSARDFILQCVRDYSPLWMRLFLSLSQTDNNATSRGRYATGGAFACCSKYGKTRIVTERAVFCFIPVRNPPIFSFTPDLIPRRAKRSAISCVPPTLEYTPESEKVLGPFCVRGLFSSFSCHKCMRSVLAASKM
jgi:hypothetical protein